MPYIASEDRDNLEPRSVRDAMTVGELTYQLTCLVDGYLAGCLDFQSIAEVTAALECTKLETYRRLAAPYEDLKKDLNGEVYVTRVPTADMKKVQA